jgi:hypothetical protein
VDKDDAPHSPSLLKQWKADHEAIIAEIRTQGYAKSLALLQSRNVEPTMAKKIISALEDRRALGQAFDAEFPDRVRQSLDNLRVRFVDLRYELADGSPLDQVLFSLNKTILEFFNAVESSNLTTLRCNSNDPEWCRFSDVLATLRKAIGLQVANLATADGVTLSADLKSIAPLAAP